MKEGRRNDVDGLRGLIAAIDNAEAEGNSAVTPSDGSSEYFVGGRSGIGSSDVARRELSSADVQRILLHEINALADQSAHYEALGERDEAVRLRIHADLIARYREI
jgi:hypothetical protein